MNICGHFIDFQFLYSVGTPYYPRSPYARCVFVINVKYGINSGIRSRTAENLEGNRVWIKFTFKYFLYMYLPIPN